MLMFVKILEADGVLGRMIADRSLITPDYYDMGVLPELLSCLVPITVRMRILGWGQSLTFSWGGNFIGAFVRYMSTESSLLRKTMVSEQGRKRDFDKSCTKDGNSSPGRNPTSISG